jgi:hypothetical protein
MQRMRAFAAWLAVAIVVVSVVKPPFEHWVSLGTLALVARGVWVTVSQIYRHRSRPVPD